MPEFFILPVEISYPFNAVHSDEVERAARAWIDSHGYRAGSMRWTPSGLEVLAEEQLQGDLIGSVDCPGLFVRARRLVRVREVLCAGPWEDVVCAARAHGVLVSAPTEPVDQLDAPRLRCYAYGSHAAVLAWYETPGIGRGSLLRVAGYDGFLYPAPEPLAVEPAPEPIAPVADAIDPCPNCGCTEPLFEGSRRPNCHCRRCARCDEWARREDLCPECGRCGACCVDRECLLSVCPDCEERFHDVCEDCGRCDGCCTCSSGAPRLEYTDRGVQWAGSPSPRYPRYVGLELECHVPREHPEWGSVNAALLALRVSVQEDGSIRGVPAGHTDAEFCTPPTRGDALEETVKRLCSELARVGAGVNRSCGLHVHVDARSMPIEKRLAIIRLYSAVEPRLYACVAPSRRDGHFCEAWGRALTPGVLDTTKPAYMREEALDRLLYGSLEEAERYKRNKYKPESRYHGLNMSAWDIHGTIEFRAHHGTLNPEKVLGWAAVCSALVQWCDVHSEAEVVALIAQWHTPSAVLAAVLPDRETRAWVVARSAHFRWLQVNARRAAAGLPPVVPVRGAAAPAEEGEAVDADGPVGRRAH